MPFFWVRVALIVDLFTPWNIHSSKLFEAYHHFITDRLPLRDPMPVPEIPASEFTREKVLELSKHFTFPLVIRDGIKGARGLEKFADREFWTTGYASEEVLCKSGSVPGGGKTTSNESKAFCTIQEFWDKADAGTPFYINGASSIMARRRELRSMVDSEITKMSTPTAKQDALAYQLFMGRKGSGSGLHSAIGVNVFRNVVGRKHWWFVPPSQSTYVWPSINKNGFSLHSKTNHTDPQGHFHRLERYETVLHPGDVLINPPWFWHAVDNLDDFTVGVPSRFASEFQRAAKASSPFLTLLAMAVIYRDHGSIESFAAKVGAEKGLDEFGRDALERAIAENRDSEQY
eukprot:gb/GEZN01010627.1/.p1 GENE.gb/GEZN01010627.1/~~gb/GEZN01010627.1/.p1  ORF type:complete len:380 (-),score=42.19 gb/GEZN01010627.1/:85-1119(-)